MCLCVYTCCTPHRLSQGVWPEAIDSYMIAHSWLAGLELGAEGHTWRLTHTAGSGWVKIDLIEEKDLPFEKQTGQYISSEFSKGL